MAEKPKMDFTKLKTRKAAASSKPPKQKVYKEVRQPDEKELTTTSAKKKKVGRKSWKEDGVEYRRLGFDTPVQTQKKIKVLLATKFYDKVSSQDELINLAINEFIEKHG